MAQESSSVSEEVSQMHIKVFETKPTSKDSTNNVPNLPEKVTLSNRTSKSAIEKVGYTCPNLRDLNSNSNDTTQTLRANEDEDNTSNDEVKKVAISYSKESLKPQHSQESTFAVKPTKEVLGSPNNCNIKLKTYVVDTHTGEVLKNSNCNEKSTLSQKQTNETEEKPSPTLHPCLCLQCSSCLFVALLVD